MVTINLAYTAPINPPGPSPLSESQVWAGLQRKVRHAQEFVPVITSCRVLSESRDQQGNLTVVREATFSDKPDPVREECVHFPPSRVDFRQADGATISNIVSRDGAGELLMTYVFEWRHPEVQEEEEAELRGKYEGMAKMAVEGSIATIRRLVAEGQI